MLIRLTSKIQQADRGTEQAKSQQCQHHRQPGEIVGQLGEVVVNNRLLFDDAQG